MLKLFCAMIAGGIIMIAGCDDTREVDPELEMDPNLEQIDPEADVELMPSGEADVDVDPNMTD